MGKMKRFKKIVSLVMAMAMVLAMTVSAFAAGGTGKITIDNALVGKEYTIYKVFDLESYNDQTGSYSYKVAAGWEKFVTSGNGSPYVSVNELGYVEWKEGLTDADTAEFAKKALVYAKDEKIGNAGTQSADATKKVEFTGLDLGYYLVDSSTGALCSLGTTSSNAVIKEKNGEPTVTKKVEEDSTSGVYGPNNDADIGQIVNFKTTISVADGAQGYILHDRMDSALRFTGDVVISINGDPNSVSNGDYTLKTSADGVSDGCTFEIEFNESFYNKIKGGDEVTVMYSAVLTESAKVAGTGNLNTTELQYGDGSYTESSNTRTYTYEFDLVKTKEDKTTVLEGATFRLYDSEKGGKEIPVVSAGDGVYRVAKKDETGVDISVGKATIKGLDGGTTYWLEEIKAPDGYNKLKDRVKVELGRQNINTADVGLVSVNNGGFKAEFNTNGTYVQGSGGVGIENHAGSLLPSTGGIGTTIFYIIGGILVVGAAILLVTKKRMGKEA